MTTKLSVMVARWMNNDRMYSNDGIIKTIIIDHDVTETKVNVKLCRSELKIVSKSFREFRQNHGFPIMRHSVNPNLVVHSISAYFDMLGSSLTWVIFVNDVMVGCPFLACQPAMVGNCAHNNI